MRKKDITDLLDRYEQMLITGKNTYFDADEYDELADYYDKLDDIETAKEIVALGLKIHPDNESLMLRYARFLVYDAKYTAALQYLNTYFSTYEFELYLLKIECFLQLGLYAEAHQLTAEVLEDEETEIEVILSELGFIYVETEYFDEAILYFEKSLEYNAENVEVLNDLIYAYEAKEDFDSAIRVCELLLDADPYGLEGWLTLGKLYSLEENYEKAIDAFDFALTLDESNVNILKLKAHCLILSDRQDEAVDMLKQCIRMDPDDALSYLTLIDSYMSMEQYANMLAVISEYEEKFGESEDSIAKKAYALFYKGDISDAEILIRRMLDIYADSYSVNIIAGDIFFKMGKLSETESSYVRALELRGDEDNEAVLEKLVSFLVKNNDIDKAIIYQKRLQETNKTPLSQEKLALLYLESGDKESFKTYIDTLSDEVLSSLFRIFYPEEQIDLPVNREFIYKRLDDIYESRILYKNIKY
ncbi:tetratricopeptide repeat protein [Dysgonomonas sp. OttesenSCG-928-M03]|nr:tetratricopeptide repeat protein [Dysgonomonas sp. OttesenSCG-928-M03]